MYTYAGLRKRYAKRITAYMAQIARECKSAGLYPDKVYPMTGDSYQWWLTVKRQKNDPIENAVDITFTICESEEYNGTENGVNFSVDIVEYNGRMLGGLTPYNYTSECWVNLSDIAAIDARFDCLMSADISSIPSLIKS